MAVQEVRVKIVTPKFRVSFPQIWHPKAVSEGGKPRYSLTALFEPSKFSDKDKELWAALKAAVGAVAMKEWKKSYKDAQAAGGYTLPFHKGDEEAKWGRGPGIVFCTLAASKRRPGIVDRNRAPMTEDGDEEFYAGCYARATVNPYVPQMYKKTLAIGLNNLQKLADGERLDSFTSAEDDFGADASEYGDDDALGIGDDDGFE